MSSKSQCESVADVIDAFGGVTAMREIFGGVPSRYYNYRMRNAFPDRMHMKIYAAALERKLNIAPELVGMKPAEKQRELPLQAAE